jgi:sugar/nucleoside kinase (ribokinase family)
MTRDANPTASGRSVTPPDYVVVGHVAKDITPSGPRLGGTAAYSALTARALGYRPGLVTAFGDDLPLEPLADMSVAHVVSAESTTFENIYSPQGRVQYLHARAASLALSAIPPDWRNAPVIHLAPLARELDFPIVTAWTGRFVCLTPQGWLRDWDADGRVSFRAWPEAESVLPYLSATVLSLEDVRGDRATVERWAKIARVLVVTNGTQGCTVFAQGETARQIPVAPRPELDPTGAGDIFATAYFTHLYTTNDPWRAARFANEIAAISVTRMGLEGVPTQAEAAMCRRKAR